MIFWQDELPDHMMGSSETMHFTLDNNGEWVDDKGYATVGSTVKAKGTITSPDPHTWNVKVESSQGWDKEYDDISTGDTLDFSIKTNFGSTKVTLKIWSTDGAADAGLQGTMTLEV